MILLAIPTQREQDGLLAHGFQESHDGVKMILSGMGSMQTAYSLTKAIHKYQPELIVHAGIAGSLKKHVHPGICGEVIIEKMIDNGAEKADHTFLTPFELKIAQANQYPFCDGVLENSSNKPATGLPQWTSITVPFASGTIKTINRRQELNCVVENMEGASVFYTCLMEQQAFISLRSISNYVTERDSSKWNFEIAFKSLAHSLNSLFSRL